MVLPSPQLSCWWAVPGWCLERFHPPFSVPSPPWLQTFAQTHRKYSHVYKSCLHTHRSKIENHSKLILGEKSYRFYLFYVIIILVSASFSTFLTIDVHGKTMWKGNLNNFCFLWEFFIGHYFTCPEHLNFAPMAPWTAASTSALGNTMNGALPPSSRDTFFTVEAHCSSNSLINIFKENRYFKIKIRSFI